MLDLVPLAGSWRKVTHRDRDAHAVRQPLDLPPPQPPAWTVAATGVGGDQQLRRAGYTGRTILRHHRRMVRAAKLAVSWSMPTLTHPALRVRSYTP